MSIREILERLVIKHKAVYVDDYINETYQAILAEFSRMLPSEKSVKEMLECLTTKDESVDELLKKNSKINQITGYNQAIQEIKAKLHIEGLQKGTQ